MGLLVSGGAASLQARVLACGGSVVGQKVFTDTYYDTPGCRLTRRDTWLRRRGQEWELKLPVLDDARRSGGERTVFREIEGIEGCTAELQPLLESEATLEELVGGAELRPFASFETTRSRYALEGCSIDADVASFGHSVIEIEVMCKDKDEVPQAEAAIAKAAELLGVTPLGGSGGKLETYIRRHCPEVLAQLVDAKVLRPE